MSATCSVSHKHVQRQEEKKVESLNGVVYTVLLCKGEETEQGAEVTSISSMTGQWGGQG